MARWTIGQESFWGRSSDKATSLERLSAAIDRGVARAADRSRR